MALKLALTRASCGSSCHSIPARTRSTRSSRLLARPEAQRKPHSGVNEQLTLFQPECAMRRVSSRLPIPCAGSALSVLALAAGLAIMPGPASAGPFDGFFPSGGPFGPSQSVIRTARLTSPQIVDILYSRYGVARIILVRPLSEVYEVDAIDRRGARVRYTVDA